MASEEQGGDLTASLRWVKYDDVYYAALLVPPDERTETLPDGYSFVYFLGTDSGCAVPTSDVHPYDPHDTARTSHPSAAEGVLLAQRLIFGEAPAENTEEVEIESAERKRMKRRAERDDSSSSSVGRGRGRKGKTKKTQKSRNVNRRNDSVGDNDSAATRSSIGDGDSEDDNEQHEQWMDMEEELNITPSPISNGAGGNRSKNRHQTTYESVIDLQSGSLVSSFIAEIRHHYRAALVEAVEKEHLLNMQESKLVRIVEAELRARRAEVLYLQKLLHDAEYERRAVVEPRHAHESDAVALEEDEVAAIRTRLDNLKSSFSVEHVVTKHLRPCERPFERRERKRAAGAGVVLGGRSSTFTDASLSFLLDAKAAAAAPWGLAKQLTQRYREQRMRREQLLTTQQGLGKMGFAAPASRVMEKWRRSRELMVLDARHETQHVSHRYSESLSKVERHALKCLSATTTATCSDSAERRLLLSTYRTQREQQQQRRKHQRMVSNLYNFHDLHNEERQGTAVYQTTSSHPYMLGGSVHDRASGGGGNDGDNSAQNAFQVPLISPLRTSFDPRATFALDFGEIAQENTLAEQLAMQSLQYSQSIHLPSQETVWANSEAYDGGNAQLRRRQRTGHSISRCGSMVRSSSRASSVAPDPSKNNMNNNSTGGGGRGGDQNSCNDWRGSAKRAILQQLTLYLRGMRGRPKVLSKDQFQSIAKKLLERAVRSESERTGLSMSLQTNNATAPFTREIEGRLRKSVDNYVQRHFDVSRTPGRQQQQQQHIQGEEMSRRGETEGWATARHDDDDADEMLSVMGAYPHATDSPVYDQ